MKRLLLLLLLIPSLSSAAITEYYVNDAGSGTGTGTTEANAMSYTNFTDYMVTGGSFTATAGDRFNIKGAITARTTTSDVWVNGGTVVSPVIVRGYNSTIGDLTSLARTNGNGPLVTTNYPTISYTTGIISVTGNFIIIEALSITSANVGANSGTLKLGGSNSYVKRCNIVNSGTNANSCSLNLSGSVNSAIDSDVSLTGASGGLAAIDMGATTSRVIGCRIKGGPALGIRSTSFPIIVFNTIFSSTGNGILINNTGGQSTILYNTIVGGGADGINILTGGSATNVIIGNMITDNTGDGIDMVSTSNAAFTSNIRTRDNANAYANAGDWITATNYDAVTTDTGGPETDYVNSGGNNYALIWGSAARGAGSPLFADIGALQAATPTPTPTATFTPTPTSTPTATATATATATPSATVNCSAECATPTATPTATFTPTATATATATPSATSTSTPTPTPVINNVIYGQ